eukprot:c1153_g1_i1.p1 GENE.c1153_g1_i1~~c1153_g1_i1.p1  ORF type:complete len:294 (+),score=17.08 c1153_g1_i1:156-1037(+)
MDYDETKHKIHKMPIKDIKKELDLSGVTRPGFGRSVLEGLLYTAQNQAHVSLTPIDSASASCTPSISCWPELGMGQQSQVIRTSPAVVSFPATESPDPEPLCQPLTTQPPLPSTHEPVTSDQHAVALGKPYHPHNTPNWTKHDMVRLLHCMVDPRCATELVRFAEGMNREELDLNTPSLFASTALTLFEDPEYIPAHIAPDIAELSSLNPSKAVVGHGADKWKQNDQNSEANFRSPTRIGQKVGTTSQPTLTLSECWAGGHSAAVCFLFVGTVSKSNRCTASATDRSWKRKFH